jgi:hypothetical protein
MYVNYKIHHHVNIYNFFFKKRVARKDCYLNIYIYIYIRVKIYKKRERGRLDQSLSIRNMLKLGKPTLLASISNNVRNIPNSKVI